jgi:putative nucleotidyltransferase with HDIG domain
MKTLQQNWKSFREYLNSIKIFNTTLDDILLKFLYVFVLVLVIVLLLPSERPFEYSNLTVNTVAPEEIIAPFKFAIQKNPEELERERKAARENIPPVYDKIPETESRQTIQLSSFFEKLQEFFKAYNASSGKKIKATPAVFSKSEALADSFLQQVSVKFNVNLDESLLQELHTLYREKKLSKLSQNLDRAIGEVYSRGLIDRSKENIPEREITAIQSGIEERIPVDEVMESKEAGEYIANFLQKRYVEESLELKTANYLIHAFLTPNLIFNDAETIERKEQSIHDVPLTRGYVEQDERIIDNNEKVTEEVYQKLYSLSVALKERSALQSGWQKAKFQSGKFLFAIILILLTAFYIYFYRENIFNDNRLLGMITIIFLMQFALGGLIENVISRPHFAIPLVLAPMLLGILLDFGVAFVSTVTLSLILGAVYGNDYILAFMMLIVSTVALFSVRRIRKRGQMYRAILFIMAAYLVTNFIFGFLHFRTVQDIFINYAYCLVDAIIIPMIAFLLIGIFERLFDVTTDITLLELSDLNHPLLKRLSVKAPGSFHHSILVANLAEAASEAIGANSLLTRVGCYFHDVGKVLKPEYFVENQMGGINKHDNLSPHMSSLILTNHVKEGLKLAQKHNLPKAVKQFIPEHHGTSLMSYFYHKLLGSSNEKDPDESNFRYPGPKPQSKETAIAMLSDTVEAASRTLNNPTPQRIRNSIDNLVEKKIKEGQLDECDLTLKQIEQIKEAFIPILNGIHHGRIEYPGETEKDKKAPREKITNTKKIDEQADSQKIEPQTRAAEISNKK